ncbi:MAG: hypothetical protein MK137_10155 [Rickettsiales bacterium]|nr:hypothetical protein [Rickettsiales bacterium]
MKRKALTAKPPSEKTKKKTSFNSEINVRECNNYLSKMTHQEKVKTKLSYINNSIAAWNEGIIDPSRSERLAKRSNVIKPKDMDSKLWVQKMLYDETAPEQDYKLPNL